MKNGVPFEKAFPKDFRMDDFWRNAMSIEFSRQEGAKFNIDTLSWEET